MLLSILFTISIIFNIIFGWYFYMTFFVVNPKMEQDLEDYSDFLVKMRQRLEVAIQRLRQVDLRGAFESDDEVGFVFKYIKNEMNELDEIINNKNDNENNE